MNTRLLQTLTFNSYFALTLMVSILAWSVALPVLLKADEISPKPIHLQNILSDSAPGASATHSISFKIDDNADNVVDIASIRILFASSSGYGFEDFGVFDGDVILNTVIPEGSNAATKLTSPEMTEVEGGGVLTLTVDTTLAQGDEFLIVVEGLSNPDHQFDYNNPLSAVTHLIDVNMRNSAQNSLGRSQTQVAIIDNITMTAAVETTFTFSVEGMASGTEINDRLTTRSASSTRLDFGIIEPDDFNFIGQRLRVSTNASNGFVVTIQESQELTSSTGERIHRFTDTEHGEEGTSSPAAWGPPAQTLDQYHTYGHYGITTTDAELASTTLAFDVDDLFTTVTDGGFVGNFHQEPRAIFGHTGPTLATGLDYEHSGWAYVGIGIEISALQPAGNDYTNTLTYVATPTF